MHLFGRGCDLEPLRHGGVPIVEDAAQAIGLPTLGRGTRCATLSFFPSKNLGAAGDAGALVSPTTPSSPTALRLLRAHGSRPKYVHHVVGGNFRLDTLQAAILRAKLPHLAAWNGARRRNADRYRALLDGTPLALPERRATATSGTTSWCASPTASATPCAPTSPPREIETEVYYPMPLHLQPCFAALGYKPGDLPRRRARRAEVLALPVHPDLTEAQQEHVAASVREFFHARA